MEFGVVADNGKLTGKTFGLRAAFRFPCYLVGRPLAEWNGCTDCFLLAALGPNFSWSPELNSESHADMVLLMCGSHFQTDEWYSIHKMLSIASWLSVFGYFGFHSLSDFRDWFFAGRLLESGWLLSISCANSHIYCGVFFIFYATGYLGHSRLLPGAPGDFTGCSD